MTAVAHGPMRHLRAAVLLPWLAIQAGAVAAAVDTHLPARLTRLSIEELAEIEISSVSKRPERLSDAAASVFVITRDDIRRSGAVTLAEVLRLAPNLQVARISSNSYAITARGFNSESANKLLVMIDGRSVYTPLHSGVFWDAQDVSLGEIDRIEVVSGAGGTLWGANAVNGVINILTRSAMDSIGAVVGGVAGNGERGAGFRYGLRLGEDAALRLYAKSFRFDDTERADGSAVPDAWDHQQTGFRADWGRRGSAVTLQGDVYDNNAEVPGSPDRKVSGANVLARWSREFSDDAGVQVQAYVDHYKRSQPGFFTEDLVTYDLDVQHRFAPAAGHEFVWGGGYRQQHDQTGGGAIFAFSPPESTLELANVFVQDTMALSPRVKLTFGLKVERNNYTGVEYQPNVRLAWKTGEQGLLWAAVSKAVRTPSRVDRDFQVFANLGPPFNGRLLGGAGFESERVRTYEIGYRGQPNPKVSYSLTAFHSEYDRLRSVEPNGSGDFVLGNLAAGHTQGVEMWGSYQAGEAWRLMVGLNLLSKRLHFEPGSRDPSSPDIAGNDPKTQFTLRSSWTLRHDVSFDMGVRHVAALPSPAVPAYTAVDARLAWAVTRAFDVSLSGFNLFDGGHAEFGAAPLRSELGQRIALRLSWTL